MRHWRDIPGYQGYQASDDGHVRSVDRTVKTSRGQRTYKGKVLVPGVSSTGYRTVALGKGNSVGVHVAVCLAFHGPRPSPKHEVRHRNGDETDNKSGNLTWADRSRNGQDKKWHKGAKCYRLNPEAVKDIKRRLADPYSGIGRVLAEEYGVQQSTISAIKNGVFHRDVL